MQNPKFFYQSFELMWHRVEKKGIELLDKSLYRVVDMGSYRRDILFLMIDAQMDLTIIHMI